MDKSKSITQSQILRNVIPGEIVARENQGFMAYIYIF
jgi:hypothetical protein